MLPEEICCQRRYAAGRDMLTEEICCQRRYRGDMLPEEICCRRRRHVKEGVLPQRKYLAKGGI